MNISPEAGKFWFTVAIAIVLLTGILLFIIAPGTPAYYINILTFVIGLPFLGAVIVMVRKSNK